MSIIVRQAGPSHLMASCSKLKNGVYWYDRRVWADVEDHVGSVRVRKSLSTRDKTEALKRLANVNVNVDCETQWNAVRAAKGPGVTSRSSHAEALALLKSLYSTNTHLPS
jgi:hypothetical protein